MSAEGQSVATAAAIGLGFTDCAAAACNLCENDTYRTGRKDWDESDRRAGVQKQRVMQKPVFWRRR